MGMNKINPSGNYFLFTINTILFYFSCGFFGTNQIVSIFILYMMANENLVCSLSLGYAAVTTVIRSIDTVLITSSQLINPIKFITPMRANQKAWVTNNYKLISLLI